RVTQSFTSFYPSAELSPSLLAKSTVKPSIFVACTTYNFPTMSAEYVRRFSTLFTGSPTNMEQRWTAGVDIDAMIESMASRTPHVKPAHVQLIKQLLSSINNVTHDHPVYPVMIREAMARLNEGMGCNKNEISEFIVREYDVSPVVNFARVVHELDKLLKVREIVLTPENRYLVRVDENESGSGSIRGMGRKRGRRGGGKGWRGSKVRKVVEENLVVEDEDDSQNVSNEGEEEEGCEGQTDGSSEEGMEKEKFPPGFEGSIDRIEEREKLVVRREVERIELLQGDDGRNELACGREGEEESVQGAGDVGEVDRVINMTEPGGNEGSGDPQETLQAECANEGTALVILPSKEVEGNNPAAQVDPTLNAETLEIASCLQPLEVESAGKKRKLQKKHDRVLNRIGDLSDTVARFHEENLQSNEAGNKKHLFDEASEEQYMELLKKAEAVQLALEDAMDEVKAVDVSNHSGTEVVALPYSVSGTAPKPEISKATRQGKRKRKTKHHKRTREVHKLLKSCPKQEACIGIQSEQLKRPTKLTIKLTPPSLPLQQNESSERQIVCGLENEGKSKWVHDRSSSQPARVHSVAAKGLKPRSACLMYDKDQTIRGPRFKIPRNREPNVKESRQARKQEVKIPMKESNINWATAGDCTQTCQQPQAEPLTSQHEKELQNLGKSLPIELALEPSTGRIIYLQNPGKQQGQIQCQGGHGKDQTSNDFCDVRTCLDHREHHDKQQVEGVRESIPNLKPSTGVTDNLSLDLEHQSYEQGKQPQVEDQISNQSEEMVKLQSIVSKQQNHDGQHQVQDSHEGIPKLKPSASISGNSLAYSEHLSHEQGKLPQFEDQISTQSEEMLNFQSDLSKQQNHDDKQQVDGTNENIPKLKLSAGVTDNLSLDLEHLPNEPGKAPQVEHQVSNQPAEMLKSHIDLSMQHNHDDQQQVEGSHVRIPQLKQCAGVTDNSLHSEHLSKELGKPLQVEDQVSKEPGVTDNSLHSEHQSKELGKPLQVEDQVSKEPEEMLKLQSDVSNQLVQLQHIQGEGANQHEEQTQCESEVRDRLVYQQQFQGQGSDQEGGHQRSEGQVSSHQKQHEEQLAGSHGDKQQCEKKPVQPQTSDEQEQGQGSSEQEELQVEAHQQSPSVLERAKSAPLTTPSSHKREQKQHQQQRVVGEGRLTRSRVAAGAVAALSPLSSSWHQRQQSPGSSDEQKCRGKQGRRSNMKNTSNEKLQGRVRGTAAAKLRRSI
ncbi:unnamed protein product, partial [Linum tenue]